MKRKILTLFGTRPEAIKLAPVIAQLSARADRFSLINVDSGQHEELLRRVPHIFGLRVDHQLRVMMRNQTLSGVCARVLSALEEVLERERPDLLLIQGDTTTALSGALAAFHRGVPAAHVEAGLRTSNPRSPFPEEMNRRLISRLASWHFAPTERNRTALVSEGVAHDRIFVTGNPVVDALLEVAPRAIPSPWLATLLAETNGMRRLIVTTHRRESFGERLAGNLAALESFVERHDDVVLFFPVHPNPAVREVALELLSGHPRILLMEPMDYTEFLVLMTRAWLIVSDSGGVQEEAASLHKPLLILRENTERPEAIEAGYARLVGADPGALGALLEEAYADDVWGKRLERVRNPFGSGDAAQRIADGIEEVLGAAPGAAAAPMQKEWITT